jgi:hypothetical protein
VPLVQALPDRRENWVRHARLFDIKCFEIDTGRRANPRSPIPCAVAKARIALRTQDAGD